MKEVFDLLLLTFSAVSLVLWVLLAAVDRLRSTIHKPKKIGRRGCFVRTAAIWRTPFRSSVRAAASS